MKSIRKMLQVLTIILFSQLAALNLSNGEPPRNPIKPIQAPPIVTPAETKTVAKNETSKSTSKSREVYDKQLLDILDQKIEISKHYMTIAHSILSSIAWFAGITAAFVAVLAFLGVKLSRQWLKKIINRNIRVVQEEVRKRLEKEVGDILANQEEVRKRLEKEIGDILAKANEGLQKCDRANEEIDGANKEILNSNARFHMRLGYLHWELGRMENEEKKKKLLAYGIVETERALDLKPPNASLIGQIKSNLSYFYAEIENRAKKQDALRLAEEAKDLASEYGEKAYNWLANYGYVKMKYADSREEITAAIDYLKSIENNPHLSEEIKGYLEECYKKMGALKAEDMA